MELWGNHWFHRRVSILNDSLLEAWGDLNVLLYEEDCVRQSVLKLPLSPMEVDSSQMVSFVLIKHAFMAPQLKKYPVNSYTHWQCYLEQNGVTEP